MTYVNGISYSK